MGSGMDERGDSFSVLYAMWSAVIAFLQDKTEEEEKLQVAIQKARYTRAYSGVVDEAYLRALVAGDEGAWAWTLAEANGQVSREDLKILQSRSPWSTDTLMGARGLAQMLVVIL